MKNKFKRSRYSKNWESDTTYRLNIAYVGCMVAILITAIIAVLFALGIISTSFFIMLFQAV